MESKARRRLLELLKREGPCGAEEIAYHLGVSAMAVRQHLYAMADQGFVVHEALRKGVGRPKKQWRLTSEADRFFPHGYSELTASLLTLMRETFGDGGLAQIVAARTKVQISSYLEKLDGIDQPRARLEALAVIRSDEGYMARVEEKNRDLLLIESHCPICAAAKACRGLCQSELDLFQSVMGDNILVERVDYILAGGSRCAYRFHSLKLEF